MKLFFSSILLFATVLTFGQIDFKALNPKRDDNLNVGNKILGPCDTWLHTPSVGSSVKIGDLDVSGNQITIEAEFNRTTNYVGNFLYAGDIVSKHDSPSDINYLLRPNSAEITTTTGYFVTPAVCLMELNKTYHVAMVYNGSTLKFYRNGFLMSQVAATGNLILNNYSTTIGDYAFPFPDVGTNFVGYINEVRIWNVARTQAQLQTYMNTPLPTPSTQTGLLAYYVFNDLLNKQGNATWNGTLFGAATINATNTSCNFIADSCRAVCTTWLNTATVGSAVKVGDLDVSGNQITVEAEFNRTAPWVGSFIYAGDLVSKHGMPTTTNYLLRPNDAEITTSNGFFSTPSICLIDLNKTYHVAMVYNGSTLRFYRNGFLMSQVPATGALFQNDFITTIGDYAFGPPVGTNFQGYINEVRIWNVARTQAQIQTYMNTSLPNPTTQVGLLGYYVFDNLTNKQGNITYNGTLSGTATINNTNPQCNFIADSCSIIPLPGISNIINDYTPVIALNPCNNKITVEDAGQFNPGDTVLMIQMKGAVIDTTNTAAFGSVIDYKNAGNYEFNYVKAKAGNIIELKNKLTRSYDIPNGKVQLIRVPYYTSVNVSGTLTCLPWDGSKGGVLVLNVRDTINLQADIDVSGNGFKGGAGYNSNTAFLSCFLNDYSYPVSHQFSGLKGESITTISNNIIRGKGKQAAGGGGGLGHNSGGGGGGNGGTGGFGGYQLDNCGSAPFDNRGIGGLTLLNNTATNKIFLGSGGGAGQADNVGNIPPGGGNGGGMAIIIANYLKSNGKNIIANGKDGVVCIEAPGSDCHDGMGGGGAGGTVLVAVTNFIDNAIMNKNGGKGATVSSTVAAAGQIGPGGGGAGGVLFINKPALPAAVSSTNAGGANGTLVLAGNTAWGATAGSNGLNVFNLLIPFDNTLFKPNIDSVRIKDSLKSCTSFDFHGFGYTNTNPIASWHWIFGDGGTANSQDTAHTYLTGGTFTVKLIVTDINGCIDSITKDITVNTYSVNAGPDTSFCGGPVSVQLQGSGTGTYSWSPSLNLNNSNTANPIATVNSTTTFYLTLTPFAGCNVKDSVTININPIPFIQTLNDTSICKGSPLVLTTTGGLTTYHWSPGLSVSDSLISNPQFTDTIPRTMIVTGTNAALCKANDTINIMIKPLPFVYAGKDTSICGNQSLTLSASGAITYTWSPVTFLSNPNIPNPLFTGNLSTTYYLTGTAANGCKGKDTISINVSSLNTLNAPQSKSICIKDTVQLDGNNGTFVQYLWSPATYLSNTTIINPVAQPPVTTTYNLTITDPVCNYDSSFTVVVTVNPLPFVNAVKSNDIDCALRNSQLTATGATQYTWTNSSTLNSPFVANPVASPQVNTLYVVTGIDMNGCKAADSLMVIVKNGINGYIIPNSFTPNGDGRNDCFGIRHWGNATQVVFIIYSRWGEKMFESNNTDKCWDGTYKGTPADAGTYVYYAKGITACGEIVQKGTVLLIR